MTLRFDWDEDKNRSNRKKHAIWFEEAQTVFDDAAARVFFDDEHSIHFCSQGNQEGAKHL